MLARAHLIGVIVLFLTGTGDLVAQADPAAVLVVLDERGCPVAGADVRLLTTDDGVAFAGVSDEIGKALVTAIKPGRYRVEAKKRSYQSGSAWLQISGALGTTKPPRTVIRLLFRPEQGSFEERSRAPADNTEPYIEYEVLYGTNRVREPFAGTRFRYTSESRDLDELETGMCVVSIPHDKKMGALSVGNWIQLPWRRWVHPDDPRYHVRLLEVCPLDTESLAEKMRDRLAASSETEALVFVHGYNTAFEDAAERTAQIGYDLKFRGPTFFYSWPSLGSEGVLGEAAYLAEAEKVKLAAPRFLELLSQIATEAKAVHVIAHSMGNQLLDEAVRLLVERGRRDVLAKLDQIALVAPDLDAEVFARSIAPRFESGSHITLYGSRQDQALAFSTRLRGRPRLGDFREKVVVVDSMDSIDVTGVDSDVGSNHYHFDDRAVIADFFYVLLGEPVFNRPGVRKVRETPPVHYELVP